MTKMVDRWKSEEGQPLFEESPDEDKVEGEEEPEEEEADKE